jgi:hypothetical protein
VYILEQFGDLSVMLLGVFRHIVERENKSYCTLVNQIRLASKQLASLLQL